MSKPNTNMYKRTIDHLTNICAIEQRASSFMAPQCVCLHQRHECEYHEALNEDNEYISTCTDMPSHPQMLAVLFPFQFHSYQGAPIWTTVVCVNTNT